MRILFFYMVFFYTGFLMGAFPSASIADVFMARKDCSSAVDQYKKELAKSYNPYIASNLAISLLCSEGDQKQTFTILKKAFAEVKNNKDYESYIVMLNYAIVLSVQKKYQESKNVISLINESDLKSEDKYIYYSVFCEDNYEVSDMNSALPYCLKSIQIKISCYNSFLTGKIFYTNKDFAMAEKHFEYVNAQCPSAENSYFTAFVLYNVNKKEQALTVLETYKKSSIKNSDLYELIKRSLGKK
jgi:tetratricopeptide (TPR) repeat protein